MQALIARHPAVITDEDGDLLLIKREQVIADSEDSRGRWSLDHLFVTAGAVPVLVEIKRASDTRLRREVVGQMLDYAANAAAYWKPGGLAATFAQTCATAGEDPDEMFARFLPGANPAEFWEQVDANFSAGRMKLVFVADKIPSELARIVEFLNEQMRADVRAVELAWFESADGALTTLTPRIIGATERARSAKAGETRPRIDVSEWLARLQASFGEPVTMLVRTAMDRLEALGCTIGVVGSSSALYALLPLGRRDIYPLFITMKKASVSVDLMLGYLNRKDCFPEEADRRYWYERYEGITGPLSSQNLNGFPGFPITALSDPDSAERFNSFASDLIAAISERVAQKG